MRRQDAETIALEALGWLAGDEDLLTVFLGATGASPASMRSGAEDADFLAAVLDFVLMDDAWVMRFCEASRIPAQRITAARNALPGGELPNWT